jgi:hypothetical protein
MKTTIQLMLMVTVGAATFYGGGYALGRWYFRATQAKPVVDMGTYKAAVVLAHPRSTRDIVAALDDPAMRAILLYSLEPKDLDKPYEDLDTLSVSTSIDLAVRDATLHWEIRLRSVPPEPEVPTIIERAPEMRERRL